VTQLEALQTENQRLQTLFESLHVQLTEALAENQRLREFVGLVRLSWEQPTTDRLAALESAIAKLDLTASDRPTA
jgi:chromosome segregation ATPase